MNDTQGKENILVDTTDCLEAVGVFRGWKNALFIISICGLFLLQASFWLVKTGLVKADSEAEQIEAAFPTIKRPSAPSLPPKTTPPPAKDLVVPLENNKKKQSTGKSNQIKKAAQDVIADPNQSVVPTPQKSSFFDFTFERLASLIRFFNFVLIPTAILYCLTMLFSLKVSLLGRLGGINHIARAFFLSLAFAVFLLPWQRFFPGVFLGAMYTPAELQNACAEARDYNIFATILHYLRFTGYWLAVLLLLIFAQLRSGRWAKAILHRLEVI
jgi:hypothetical protein